MDKVTPPGGMLEFFMENRRFSTDSLVRGTGLSFECVQSILNNAHRITPEVAEKLGRFFGMTTGSWLNLQKLYDNQPGIQPMQTMCEACEA